MTLQPAFETLLDNDGYVVMLRASLRAAVAIDAMPGGFPKVWEQIARQSVTAIRQVLLAAATDRQEAHRFLAATADKPLSRFISGAQAACLAVMTAFLSTGDDSAADAPSQGSTSGTPMPLREYFQTLYRFATGWLGWTPADTWAASPTEIEAAFAAHTDRLVLLTPGLSADADETKPARQTTSPEYTPERLAEIEELGFDPAFDRQALRSLRARTQ